MKELLVYAIGNPARGDDGLGPAIAEALNYSETIIVYQPSIEDAELISHYHKVLFIDAQMNLEQDFEVREVLPNIQAPVFTHGLSLDGLLGLCQQLYNYTPQAYVLGLQAKQFELGSAMREPPSPLNIKRELTKILPHIF